MNKPDITLRVKIDTNQLSREDLLDIERWANEGGQATDNRFDTYINLPIRRGDILEVRSMTVIYEQVPLLEIELDLLAHEP